MPVTSSEHDRSGADGDLRVRLLGPIEVLAGKNEVPLRRGRQRLLVAALALDAGRVVPRGRLVEALWPGTEPDDPSNALQHLVAQVRRALGTRRHVLRTASGGYVLDLPRDAVDALAVEDALAGARAALAAGDSERACELAEGALARWRGDALADADDGPLRADAARLDDARVDAELLRADALLALGRAEEVVDRLAALAEREPLREPIWARLLAALAAVGRSAEALAVYEEVRRRLSEELGARPGQELRELHGRIVRGEEGPTPASAARSSALPAPATSFIGREAEMDEIRAALERGMRLVTLTGPGGAGKTRLAIEAGRRTVVATRDGTHFVRLDAVEEGEAVLGALALGVRLREDPGRPIIDTLIDQLQGRRLLVLDNCEHVSAAVAALAAELLSRCADLTILATSRERLGLAGEVVVRVGPLALPRDAGAEDAAAVSLFVERARAARPDLVWDQAQLIAAAHIALALDGLPLAIELAAARTATLLPTQIASGLGDRFAILDGALRSPVARHSGLRAAVAWSHNLLAVEERPLFDELSVFAGPIDATAAAVVIGAPDAQALLPRLLDLADKSLLETAGGDAERPRFRMLRTLRAYGLERLAARGAERRAREAHLAYFAALARDADAGIRGPQQREWLARLDDAYEDVRAALRWSATGGSLATGLTLIGALGRYLDWRGHLRDADEWSARLLGAEGAEQLDAAGPARAWRAYVLWEFGSGAEAEREAQLALAHSRAAGDLEGEMLAHAVLTIGVRGEGRFQDAVAASGRALSVAERQGDPWWAAWARNARGFAFAALGELDAAERDARTAAVSFERIGDERGHAWSLTLDALLAARRGRWQARCAQEAVEVARSLGDGRTETIGLEIVAGIARNVGGEGGEELLASAARARRARGQVAPRYQDAGALLGARALPDGTD